MEQSKRYSAEKREARKYVCLNMTFHKNSWKLNVHQKQKENQKN
jgi:hypothetical protein